MVDGWKITPGSARLRLSRNPPEKHTWDPNREGCQSYEATLFLTYPRRFDTSTPLVLWQVSALGQLGVVTGPPKRSRLTVLVDYLARFYGRRHPVVLYEASRSRRRAPRIQHLRLSSLANADLSGLPTLLVPAKASAAADRRMFDQLKMGRGQTGPVPGSNVAAGRRESPRTVRRPAASK